MYNEQILKTMLILALAGVLCACAAPRQDNPLTSIASQPQQTTQTVDAQPVFVSVKRFDLNQPREVERERLKQISSMLTQVLNLVSQAQEQADYSDRVMFDYSTMLLDLQAIHFGLNQYFLTNIRSPRMPTQINNYPVQGSYMKVDR